MQVVTREVNLPGGKGKQQMEFRVTGITAFLTAKADALRRRDKNKDAYDIVWLLDAWPGGPAGAGQVVRESHFFQRTEVAQTSSVLADQFGDIDRAGARAYARFLADATDDLDVLARHAVGAVGGFLQSLRD